MVEILERGKNRIVGKVKVFANYALVKPDNKGFHEDVFVSKDKINEAKTNDLVIVEIESYPNGSIQASGKIIEILGQAGDNDAEMNAIMAEFGLPVKFPDDVHNEAEAISEVITPAEIKKRKDFRDTLTFTIDPADAKDFDDAISYKNLITAMLRLEYISQTCHITCSQAPGLKKRHTAGPHLFIWLTVLFRCCPKNFLIICAL